MEKIASLPEKFFEVLKHEGVVSVTSWGVTPTPHVVNSWNSYVVVTPDERILLPVFGFRRTQKNVEHTGKALLTLGSKEVLGYKDYQGTGFYIEGDGRFFNSGEEYDMMKEKFPFINRVMEVTVTKIQQKI